MKYQPTLPAYPPTVGHAIRDAARRHGDRTFLIHNTQRLTYAQVERASARSARKLLAAGIGKATRFAIVLPNTPDWITTWFAAGRIGALTLPLSTFFEARELDWALHKGDVDTLVICTQFLGRDYMERLERAVPGLKDQKGTTLRLHSHPYLRRVIVLGDYADGRERAWATRGFDALDAADAESVDDAFLEAVEAQVVPADLFVGICTSGSTAEPKIVIHTHGSAIRATHAYRPFVAIAPDEVNYSGMPFFWIGGLNVNLLPVMYEGAAMLLTDTPRPDDVLDALVRERATRVSAWKPQIAALLARAAERGIDLSFVRRGLGPPKDAQGQPIPANRRLVLMMGMTESFGPHSVEFNNRILPPEKEGNWGCELVGQERLVVDPSTGEPLPPGKNGELLIRGFLMADGYYKRERAEVFRPDGFFATGDEAAIDEDGYVYFKGRLTEMMKVAGANVAPKEVEEALQRLPGVAEAIVLGLPDALKGETIRAFVVPAQGHALDGEALRRALSKDISGYKVPARIDIVAHEDIPRTDMGKPRKPQLREKLLAARAAPQTNQGDDSHAA